MTSSEKETDVDNLCSVIPLRNRSKVKNKTGLQDSNVQSVSGTEEVVKSETDEDSSDSIDTINSLSAISNIQEIARKRGARRFR